MKTYVYSLFFLPTRITDKEQLHRPVLALYIVEGQILQMQFSLFVLLDAYASMEETMKRISIAQRTLYHRETDDALTWGKEGGGGWGGVGW